MAAPCSSSLWKVELMSNKMEYIAEEIYKQSVEGVVMTLLHVHRKLQKAEDELKKNLLIKKKHKLEDLENFQPIQTAKNKKYCSEENTKGVAERSVI